MSGVQRGSILSAAIGYWVSREFAGRGITPLAVAITSDFLFTEWGLHRVEINIRPENAATCAWWTSSVPGRGPAPRHMHIAERGWTTGASPHRAGGARRGPAVAGTHLDMGAGV